MPKRIHPDVEREVRRLAAKGHKLREIGRMLGYSRHAVTNTLRREARPAATAGWSAASGRLSLEEREKIRVGPGARRHVHCYRYQAAPGCVDGVPVRRGGRWCRDDRRVGRWSEVGECC